MAADHLPLWFREGSRNDWPDLSRTAAAIAAFDRGEVDGEAVGVAFGLDTADRNEPETCRQIIRPGPQHPLAGELSFVRRLVLRWEQRGRDGL